MDDLGALLDLGWASLTDIRPDAPARLPVLATVTPAGLPQARTVVLRAVDRTGGWAEVHTDASSPKIADLTGLAQAALCIWDAPRNLQIRIAARTEVLSGDGAADRWNRVPEASRTGYGAVPPPGTPIHAATAYHRSAAPEGHAVIRLTFGALDLLSLGPPQRRAVFRADGGWTGTWLSP